MSAKKNYPCVVCGGDSTMRCPTCMKQGKISESLYTFCSQKCFKSVWKKHKLLHSDTQSENDLSSRMRRSALLMPHDPAYLLRRVFPPFAAARNWGPNKENNGFITIGKLRGAEAEMWIRTVQSMLENIRDDCIVTPDEIPIFSMLSAQHQITLIGEVVAGLLDPAVPLPPDTPEHLSTFLAFHSYLNTQIEVEADTSYDNQEECEGEWHLLQPHEREALERQDEVVAAYDKEEAIRRKERIAFRQSQMSDEEKEARQRLNEIQDRSEGGLMNKHQFAFDERQERKQKKQVKKMSQQVSLDGPLKSVNDEKRLNPPDFLGTFNGVEVTRFFGTYPFLLLGPDPGSSPPKHIDTSVLTSSWVFYHRQTMYNYLYERNPFINITPFCAVIDYWHSIQAFLNNHLLLLDDHTSNLIRGEVDLNVAQQSEAGLRRYRLVNDHVASITREFEDNWDNRSKSAFTVSNRLLYEDMLRGQGLFCEAARLSHLPNWIKLKELAVNTMEKYPLPADCPEDEKRLIQGHYMFLYVADWHQVMQDEGYDYTNLSHRLAALRELEKLPDMFSPEWLLAATFFPSSNRIYGSKPNASEYLYKSDEAICSRKSVMPV